MGGTASAPAILFVCLGNICRSPMAEGAARMIAAERGMDVVLDSAGTGGWHRGEPPDPRAIACAADTGRTFPGFAGDRCHARILRASTM